MDPLKSLDTAHAFCQMLLQGETGNREELAKKLGITPRWVSVYKHKIELLYGVHIHFCRKKQSYCIENDDFDRLPPHYL